MGMVTRFLFAEVTLCCILGRMDSRVVFVPALLWAASTLAQSAPAPSITPNGAARPANTDKTYAALRSDLPAADGIAVKDLTLERGGAVFHFDAGSFYFYTPVEGHVTGAVFEGKGSFTLAPEQKSEQKSLALLTKSPTMNQDFSTLVLRFTDGTAEEIRKASTGAESAANGHARSAAEDLAKQLRKYLSDNFDLRLLADVDSGAKGQFFVASFRMGNLVNGKNLLFIVDPEGSFNASPDQVELTSWGVNELQPWVAYRMKDADAALQGERAQVTDENLDVAFERSGMMRNSAITTLKVRRNGVRVVRLNLFSTLRVNGVFAENGAPLDFVQEPKELDPDFAVILPEPAKAGDTIRLLIQYAGKDALRSDGNDTYFLIARESWYPAGQGQLGDFANFHMTFHVPKGLTVVATGKQMSVTPENGETKAVWETQAPIAVAGFNIGGFKTLEGKTPQGFTVDAYANSGLPDAYRPLADEGDMGGFEASSALKTLVAQGTAAIQIYSAYFGNLPYDHVALTEQTACNFGQSWPMLVYLPICGFWDSTVQNALGLQALGMGSYWTEVTPHEVAHQWWGQLVGFNSYRDQWMSEGFAEFSAGLFKKNTSRKLDDYLDFWKEQQKLLIQKNEQGVRAIDAGPLTMGQRLNNDKAGQNIYQDLIYSKGAYVLHMLEMQFAGAKDGGEGAFKNSMQQFVKEYSGKAATTEDWKASMERTMPKSLDLDGNGKLDWFFNEWVYGTALPHYTVNSQLIPNSDGTTTGYLKLTQSNVPDTFVMIVPLYMQFTDGKVTHFAGLTMRGNMTFEQKFPLGKLPANAKGIVINAYADILTDNTD
jgi:hypothetical protein